MSLAGGPPQRLSQPQRQEFRNIRQTQGKQAARSFRQGILGGPGGAGGPTVPETGTPTRPSYEGVGQQVNQNMMGQLEAAQAGPSMDQRIAAMGPGIDPNGFASQREEVIQRNMDEFNRQMSPQFKQQEEQMMQRLRNQGIDPGSPQGQDFMKGMFEGQGGAQANAMTQAFNLGGTEQQRLYGMASDARGQQLNEAMIGHNSPYQNINALGGMYNAGMGLYQQDRAQNFQDQQREKSQGYDWQKTQYGGDLQKWLSQNQKFAPTGPGYDVFGLANLNNQNQMARDRQAFEHNMALAQMNRPRRPSTGDQIGGAVGSIAGGFASGFGAGLAG